MYWALFAVAAGILWAGTNFTGKHIMEDSGSFEFTLIYSWTAMLLYLPLFLYFLSQSSITLKFSAWAAFIVSGFGNIGGILSLYFAIKNTDISIALPIGKITPVLVAFNAWIILGEALSLLNIVGVGVVTVGSYILLLDPDTGGLEPLKRILTDKPVLFSLLSALSFSFAAVADRFATQSIPPKIYTFLIYLFLTFALTPIALYKGKFSRAKKQAFSRPWLYILAGALTILASLATFTAFSLEKAGRVVPVMRMDIFLSVIIGGKLFQEKNLVRKAIGCILIIGGIALVVA